MLFFIPPLGTRFRLKQHFSFELVHEERNKSLWNLFAAFPYERHTYKNRGVTTNVQLSPGDTLIVDRIYVRKGYTEYSSVTFRGHVKVDGVNHKVRFFVNLPDINGIEMEVVHG